MFINIKKFTNNGQRPIIKAKGELITMHQSILKMFLKFILLGLRQKVT